MAVDTTLKLQMVNVDCLTITDIDNDTSTTSISSIDSTFLQGRCAEVYACGEVIGKLGVIHPEVITAFDLGMPAAAIEINIEPFL